MPRCKRFDVINLLGGGRRFPNLGRRTANLRPGEEDGRQHSAEFHRNTHGSPPAYLYATQMMCQPPLEKTLSYYPPMSMAPVGLACLLERFEYNNNATQPVSFYSESHS